MILKLNIIDKDEFEIYLFNKISNIHFKSEKYIEAFLRKLFIRLKKYYDLKISGFYEIDVFIDKSYGIILNIRKNKLDYYELYDNQVDMKIKINYYKFLYLIDNYNFKKSNYDIYMYKDNIYLLPNKKIDNIELANLIENSKIIYNSKDILEKGKKISN